MSDANAPSEIDRWRLESDLREREMALKERDHELRREELALKRAEATQSRYRNPLVVAIFAAAIAAGGNALVAFVNGQQTRRVEEVRAEAGRILEMIKTGEPDSAAANLSFLARTGLISNPDRLAAIEDFLTNRAPGEGPALPTATGGEVARPARDLPVDDALRALGDSVGRLLAGGQDVCTSFFVGPNRLIAPDFCIPEGEQDLLFLHALDVETLAPSSLWTLNPKPVETISLADATLHLLAFEASPEGVIAWSPLSARAPKVGDPIATVFFRGNETLLVARDPSCAVTAVTDTMFAHPCVMGGGAAGAPILSPDGAEVIGVHVNVQRLAEGQLSWAVRADRILEASPTLAAVGRPGP